ncbi:MAG: hypothetical protein WAW36_17170 [Methylovulum miyakonense]|uniref:hypothetical protein n=1 Tax=Methylovulum miyakonense TaxID=645578 RepID=UPI003BB55E2A
MDKNHGWQMKIKARVYCDGAYHDTSEIDISPIQLISLQKFKYGYLKNEVNFLNIFQEKHRVPDVLRYFIKVFNNKVNVLKFVEQRLESSSYNDYLAEEGCKENPQHSILLVLESPHKDEYYYDEQNYLLIPKSPAQGATGRNIENCLRHVLEEIANSYGLDDGCYHLIIVEPIPYMCSLGVFNPEKKLNEDIRNRVWKAIWSVSEIKNDFVNRCRKYNPKYIINACTDYNDDGGTLAEIIREVLVNNFSDKELYESPHPSSRWWCKKKIWKIQKIEGHTIYIKKTR